LPTQEERTVNRFTRVSAVVAATLVAGTVATLPAAAQSSRVGAVRAQQGIGIKLLDASVARKKDPRARIYIDDFLRPGTTITRHILVSDFTPKPVHLLMYAVSSSIDTNGWQVANGRQSNELTSWTHVSPAAVDLQPGKSATVTVDIDVPATASKGERYATVVAELPAPAQKHTSSVAVATRVGVRVYLDVGPGGEPASDFTISTLTAARLDDGTPVVSAQVTNIGDRALDLGGRLQLSHGPGGLRAGPYDVQVPRTLGIGKTGDVVVALDKQTPVGPWLAKMALRSGYVHHAVTGRISFPLASGTSAKPVKAHPVPLTKNRNVLVPVAIGLILLMLIGLLLFLLWKRRNREDDEEDDGPHGSGTPALPTQRRHADESTHA
jgi:hypothetical protein